MAQFKDQWVLPDRKSTKTWFNERANSIWSDHKSRVLKPYFSAAEGDLRKAIANSPTTLIDVACWKKLCQKFTKCENPSDDPNGKSKSQKCKDARGCNDMNHSMGRMNLDYWVHKHFQLFGRNPTVLEFCKKTYMSDDPTEAIEASSQTDQPERSEETR